VTYVIAAYGLAAGLILAYVASVRLRRRDVRRELEDLAAPNGGPDPTD
jgi:heme exporter protein CcmD